jgi:type IV secretion system protein VirB9
MRTLISIATLLTCTASAVAFSSAAMAQHPSMMTPQLMSEDELPQDERIKILPYDETDVYTLTTKPGYQTNVVFGRGEEVITISVGDRSFWQIVPAGNRMFIRPMNEDVTTNMTVITNRHSYQFDLKSISLTEDKGNIYVAKFIYPRRTHSTGPYMATARIPSTVTNPVQPMMGPPPGMMAPAAPVPVQAVPHQNPSISLPPERFSTAPGSMKPPYTPPPCVPPECIPPGVQHTPDQGAPPYVPAASGPGISHPVGPNFNYTYSGPDDLSPLQVYDDGGSTYITYRQTKEPLPNIYLVDRNGNERPTTYYIKGEAMVVDSVSPQMALKSSSGTVYIYNELLDPQ